MLTLLVFVGLGVFGGVWMTFQFECYVSSGFRVLGFPIPLAAFELSHGDWVDFVSPSWFQTAAVVTNVTVAIGVAVLPVLAASLVFRPQKNVSYEIDV